MGVERTSGSGGISTGDTLDLLGDKTGKAGDKDKKDPNSTAKDKLKNMGAKTIDELKEAAQGVVSGQRDALATSANALSPSAKKDDEVSKSAKGTAGAAAKSHLV